MKLPRLSMKLAKDSDPNEKKFYQALFPIPRWSLKNNDNIAIMINSLGATPLEELYIISKRVNENLSNSKINNIKTYVGRYATSMEMAGMSITTLKLSDNLKKYLFAPSECPFWNN